MYNPIINKFSIHFCGHYFIKALKVTYTKGFRMEIRVYYEDTDVGGVVYYANYLKFCERARSELFFERGLSPHNDDEFFVVKHVEADYIKSAVFGDLLEVKTTLIEKKAASITLYQEVFRDEELLFTGSFKLAFLKNFKPTRIPKELFEVFNKEHKNVK